jgi:hypothetical protein
VAKHVDREPFDELAWLAFAAQKRGWDSLAERIAQDVAAAKDRQEELELRWSELFPDQDSENAA